MMATTGYTVLVTGSAGHLGTALMLTLEQYGHQPYGLDVLPGPSTTRVGSITDRPLLERILAEHLSIRHIVHSATLHKPHVDPHPKSAFIDVNITGTLNLLEVAASLGERIQSFVFISTTSTFGKALAPRPGQPAAWIDESVVPIPKNIYGVTKCAAEELCKLVHDQSKLPVVILRTSRFFPEADDDEDRRMSMGDRNLKVCELAYRRVDIDDVVRAVVCAMGVAPRLGFGKYIISAPPPFASTGDRSALLQSLDEDAGQAMRQAVPASAAVFESRNWNFLPRIDRVYCSSAAVKDLGWEPKWTFERVIERLAAGEDWRSELTYKVGKRGYHAQPTGVYTTEEASLENQASL